MLKIKTILFFTLLACFAYAQTLTIDEAIVENSNMFSQRIPAKTRVVILNIESESKNLSNYIVSEIESHIDNNTELWLVSKNRLANVLQESGISDLNLIDETTALEIGKKLGAQSVILGSISRLGENYRFRTQALSVEDGNVLAMLSLNIREDEIMSDLLEMGARPAPAPMLVQQEANQQDRIEAEIRARIETEMAIRARIEAEMRQQAQQQQPSVQVVVVRDTIIKEAAPAAKQKTHTNNFLVSAKFQMSHSSVRFETERYDSFSRRYIYDSYTGDINNSSINLEIGGINGRRGFTVHGILDFGAGDWGIGWGGGVFLGWTTVNVNNNVFRFKGGMDLGLWVDLLENINVDLNTAGNVMGDRIRFYSDRLTWGGPSLDFLVGHKPVFFSFGFKTYFGMQDFWSNTVLDYRWDSSTSFYDHHNYYGYFGFAAVYKWNIGITATF